MAVVARATKDAPLEVAWVPAPSGAYAYGIEVASCLSSEYYKKQPELRKGEGDGDDGSKINGHGGDSEGDMLSFSGAGSDCGIKILWFGPDTQSTKCWKSYANITELHGLI